MAKDLHVEWSRYGSGPLRVKGPAYQMIRSPLGIEYVKLTDSATLTRPRQSGHEIEGRVTIKGKSYSAFTSGGSNPDGGDGCIIVRAATARARGARKRPTYRSR